MHVFTGEFSGRAIRTLYHPAPSTLFFAFISTCLLYQALSPYMLLHCHYIALVTYLVYCTVYRFACVSLSSFTYIFAVDLAQDPTVCDNADPENDQIKLSHIGIFIVAHRHRQQLVI